MKLLWPVAAILLSTGLAAAAAPLPAIVEPSQGISIDAALAASDGANIDLVTARNAIKTAAAGVRSADTAPNPTLGYNLGHFQFHPDPQAGGQQLDQVFSVDVPLESGGKRTARVAAAKAGLAAAGSDANDTRRQVHAAVIAAFYDLMAAERKLELNTRIAESYRTSQSLASKRLAAGAISGGDLARQNVETLRAASALSQAASARREAQLALAILIGREAAAPDLKTIGDWPQPRAASPDDAEILADRRPDVRAAVQRVEAARYQLKGARALRHPDVTAGVQYEHDPGAFGNTFGVGVSVPIPVRNGYNGEVDAAGVGLSQSEALAAKARAVAVADIITARRAAAEAVARRNEYETALLPAARKAAETAEFAYARGALALLDLLDARRTLQSVELDAIDAHADEARALARLSAAETAGDE